MQKNSQKGENNMKRNYLRQYVALLAAVGLASALVPCLAAPTVIVAPTPPTTVVAPVVPDYYVWDGDEYVGVVGDNYYYLGPGNVWMLMDAHRMHHFQDWERSHKDWRTHATHNVRYKNAPPPQVEPMRDVNQNTPALWNHGQNQQNNPDRGYGQDVNTPGGP